MTDRLHDELFDSAFLSRLEYLRVVARRVFAGANPGSRTGKGAGPGLEFSEHRAYAPGDDWRQIDWAAYGRLDKLLLRLCRQEEDLSIYFMLDASGSMATGRPPKFDHARRLAAALAYIGLATLESVRLVAVDGGVKAHLEAGRGQGRILPVLDFLRGLEAKGPTDLARAVEGFLPHAPRTGLVVLISDFLDPSGWERSLAALVGRRFDLWCIQATDPSDLAPPGGGDLAVTDGETGETLAVHLTDEVRLRLAEAAARHKADLSAWCRSHGVNFAEAPTALPVDALVLEVLRHEGFLR